VIDIRDIFDLKCVKLEFPIMTYEKLKNLRANNHTLRVLNSDNFAFTLSFFYLTFTKNSKITLEHSEILSHLDDYLFNLNEIYSNAYPREAKEYLEEFVSEKNGYLKKYHDSADEAVYELTPHTQKALEFLESLEKKEFVGSRSKFNIIFDLLEELAFETNMSDEERIEQLKAQKHAIDKQIEDIKAKRDIRFDNSRVKEHYMQIEEMVRKLKYDFSEIEYNFRSLNTTTMEKIALYSESKSDVLNSIFEIEDDIRQSDQGKSFFAFWQLLSDNERSEKLRDLIESLYSIESLKKIDSEKKLINLQYSLLKSGEKVYGVSLKLIEQLRRFLDDRVWAENRRILELCADIEKKAIEIKEQIPTRQKFTSINDSKVKIDSIFSKSLYEPKRDQAFLKEIVVDKTEIDMESFYNIFFIDEELLARNIEEALLLRSQATLKEIVEKNPIEKGVSELVAYISLAKRSSNVYDAYIDEDATEILIIQDNNAVKKKIKMPKIIFVRER